MNTSSSRYFPPEEYLWKYRASFHASFRWTTKDAKNISFICNLQMLSILGVDILISIEIQHLFWKRMWTMKQRCEKKMQSCRMWEVTAYKSTTMWSSHRDKLTFKRLKDTEGRFRKGKQMMSTPMWGTITDKEALTCDLWATYVSSELLSK